MQEEKKKNKEPWQAYPPKLHLIISETKEPALVRRLSVLLFRNYMLMMINFVLSLIIVVTSSTPSVVPS